MPAVVLAPGLGASSVGWSLVRRGAAELTRVIAYDRPGLGASAASLRPRTLGALAEELSVVIETRNGDAPVVIVGHSLGATIAQLLALTRAEQVAGLVLIDPVPERFVCRYGPWVKPVGHLMYGTLELLAQLCLIDTVTAVPPFSAITRSSTSPLVAFNPVERLALAAEMRCPLSHRTARREFYGLLHSHREIQVLTTTGAVHVPLTVISGGHAGNRIAARLRRAATAEHARLVDASPDGRHIVVPDGGHLISRYQPDIIVAAISDQLDRIRSHLLINAGER